MSQPQNEAADLRPEDDSELAEMLAEATAKGEQVMVQGHGSRASLGALIDNSYTTLSTAELNGVVHYEPGDLTITVGAGMPLAELSRLLDANGQVLPAQAYRRAGTVGGLLASAADGALAAGYGTVRDVVIGAAIAYSDGSLARARGRVVKNVAGYDLPRLMCGSMGTLGVLTEVSFKLQPKPPRSASLVAGFASAHEAFAAARAVTAQPWEPVFAEVFLGACTAQLAVGLDGRDDRVEGLLQQLQDLLIEHHSTGQLVLDGQQDSELRTRLDAPVRSAVHNTLDNTPDDVNTSVSTGAHWATDSAAPGVVLRWWGSVADVQGTAERLTAQQPHGLITRLDARPLLGQIFASIDHQDAAALQGFTLGLLSTLRQTGSAVLLSAPDDLRRHADTVWGPPPSDFVLMTQLKAALDPSGTFAPGRFVGGL